MKKRVIVHVGLPKCGSTYLQVLLRTHRVAALDHGVFAPVDADSIYASHMPLVNDLAKWRSGAPIKRLAGYVDAFEASGAHTMVLTSESFAIRAERIAPGAIGGRLTAYDVDLVLFFRRHDRWLLSFYKQSVRMPSRRYAGSFRDLVRSPPGFATNTARFDIARSLDVLTAVFGARSTELIDLDAGESDVSVPFARISGLPLAEWQAKSARERTNHLEAPGVRNTSLSDVKTLFLVECNRREIADDIYAELLATIRRVALADDLEGIRILSERWSEKLLSAFRRHNATLADRYGITLHDHRPLVPDGIVRETLHPDEYEAIAMALRPHLTGSAYAEVTGSG